MPQFPSLTPVVVALVLMLNVTPSWGQPVCASPGCNPTVSDANANTAGGSEALADVVTIGATQGFLNTAFGRQALRLNTTGSFNIAIGAGTLQNNTSGNLNVANGVGALGNNTTGGGNTAIGNGALLSNTTGFSNTASGANSLNSNSIGSNNIAIGVNALFSNDSGNLNTANGFQALESNVAGTNNTAIGAKALKKSLGTKNIGIGFQAGVSLVNGNNNIYIGNQGAGDEFLTIRIGTAQTQTFIAGINGAIVSGTTVEIDTTTGQLGVVPSSARYKQDIVPMGMSSDGVRHLRPVTFSYKEDAQKVKHYGLIAEKWPPRTRTW